MVWHAAGELAWVVCEGAVAADAGGAAPAREEMCLLYRLLMRLLAREAIPLLGGPLLDLLSCVSRCRLAQRSRRLLF